MCHALKIPQNSGENTRRLPPHATKIDTFFAYLADVQNLQKHRNEYKKPEKDITRNHVVQQNHFRFSSVFFIFCVKLQILLIYLITMKNNLCMSRYLLFYFRWSDIAERGKQWLRGGL